MVEFFFNPKTIAVIGATANPKKFGNAVTINILQNKELECELFLITKSSQEVKGIKCYPSILEVQKAIDLAIILVPSEIVDSVIDDCIQKKVKGIIIITAGFGEIDAKGRERENLIAKKCKKAGIRVIGPNCVGIQNNDIGLNASFIQMAPNGKISMISQSGSFGCASFYAMEQENIGFTKFANLGNMIDVCFEDILEFYDSDQNSEVLCIYMETVLHGRSLLNSIKNVGHKKPIIILKGGRTSTGMKAASSHTGSIATDYKVLKNAFRQSGAVITENAEDFITALKTFSLLPLPKGNRIGVLTNSGGSSVLFSDKAEEFNLTFINFSENLKNHLKPFLIPLVKIINPLDMIGVAGKEQYYQITKTMLESDEIDIVVPCAVIPPFLEMSSEEHYEGIIKAWNDTSRQKPIIPLLFFADKFDNIKEIARKERSPVFFTPHEAAYAVKLLVERMYFLRQHN
jgi:acetyl-CoA synthetase (ADP-forming)